MKLTNEEIINQIDDNNQAVFFIASIMAITLLVSGVMIIYIAIN